MVAEHFEVAVLGRAPAGLLVAAHLARAGRRVVVVETPHEAANPPPEPLAADAAGHILGVLEGQAPHLRALHAAMGLTGPAARPATAPALPPACRTQVIFSRGRIALPMGRARPRGPELEGAPEAQEDAAMLPVAAEWAAEFAQGSRADTGAWSSQMAREDARLTALLAGLPDGPPAHLWGRWRARRTAAALARWRQPAASQPHYTAPAGPAPEALRAMLMAALPFGVGAVEAEASCLQATRLWGRLLAGGGLLAELDGGAALVPNFLAGAQRAGVQLVLGQPIVRLVGGRRRIDFCEISGRRGRVGADFFVLNVDGSAPPLPAAGPLATRLARALAATRTPVAHLARLQVPMPRAAVPPPLAPVTLLINGRGPREAAPADPPLCLRRLRIDGDSEVLEVACPLPAPPDASARSQALDHVWPRLRRALPHLPAHRERGRWSDRALPLYAPPAGGSAWQALMHRPQKTPVANLIDARADVVCGLGVEGAYAVAQLTCQALRRAAGATWRQRPEN